MSGIPMSLSIEEVRDPRELPEYKREWDQLSHESREGDLFHTYDWLTAWLAAFWPDRAIAFMFVRDEAKRLMGCVPLVPDDQGRLWCRGSLVSPVNDESMRTCIVAADRYEEVALSVLEHLRRTRQDVRLAFRTVLSDSWVATELPRKVAELNMSSVVMLRPSSPYVDLTCGKEQYYRERSSHFRHEMRRKARRIEKAGEVKRVTVTSEEDLDWAMADVSQIEKNSWKQDMGSAFTSNDSIMRFYEGFARNSAADGWFRLHLLYLDGQPIAHLYGATFKNRYYAIKTSYDRRYHEHSPGAVLLGYALDDSFEQGFDCLDLLGEGAKWKKDLATGVQTQVDVCVFPETRIRCRVCRQFEVTGRPFVEHHLHQTGICRRIEGTIKPFVKKRFPGLVRTKRAFREKLRTWLR